MKSVGIREFRDHATKLIAAGETLAIEKHGEPVGFYVPIVAKDREVGVKVLERLGSVVSDVLEQTGLTEDELVAAIRDVEVERPALIAGPGAGNYPEMGAGISMVQWPKGGPAQEPTYPIEFSGAIDAPPGVEPQPDEARS